MAALVTRIKPGMLFTWGTLRDRPSGFIIIMAVGGGYVTHYSVWKHFGDGNDDDRKYTVSSTSPSTILTFIEQGFWHPHI